MGDPFEIRLQFTKMLQRLNASVNASKSCAAFALKHKELDEDLHSCILEQLETSSMNNRVNLLYFIEHLLEMSVSKGITNYVSMVQADFRTIVDCVSPADQSGLQNIASTRKVLGKIKDQKLIAADVYDDLLASLDEREKAGQHQHSDDEDDTLDDAAANKSESEELDEVDQIPAHSTTTATMVGKDPPSTSNSTKISPADATSGAAPAPYSPTAVNPADITSIGNTPSTVESSRRQSSAYNSFAGPQPTAFKRPPKQVIEERMEEDRERHKRLRETIWAIYPSREEDEDGNEVNGVDRGLEGLEGLVGPEFEMFWKDVTLVEINEDDMEVMAEEAELKVESLS